MKRLVKSALLLLPTNNFYRFSDQPTKMYKKETPEELKKRLTPIQYEVTQHAGTERPYTSKNVCYLRLVQ
jgi:hypothetical protein